MRVSGGREVTDLSGKTRIHSLPLRFMFRVSATRAASSCVLVIQARSSVCKPNSPKSILRSEEHTSELQSHLNLVCRLLLEKKKKKRRNSQRRARLHTVEL